MSEVSLWFYSLGGEYMAKVLKAIKVLFVFFTKDEAAASGGKGFASSTQRCFYRVIPGSTNLKCKPLHSMQGASSRFCQRRQKSPYHTK